MLALIESLEEEKERVALQKSKETVKRVTPEIVALYRSLSKALQLSEMPYDLDDAYHLRDAQRNLEGVLEDLGVDLVEWGGKDYPE